MITTKNSYFDIIIGGGSFIGLTLAKALDSSSGGSLKIAVVDRMSPFTDIDLKFDGRSSALSAASVQMLQALEIWQHVENDAQPIRDIEITDSPLESSLRPIFLQFDGTIEAGKPASYMLENFKLRQAISTALGSCVNVTFLTPQSVSGFKVHDHRVDVFLEEEETLQASLLIAADGRKSQLRAQAGIKIVSWKYEQTGIVATVGHEKPHNGCAVQHFLPAGPFAILPLKGNRSSLVWTEDRERAAEILSLDDDRFLCELKRRFGHKLGELTLEGPRGAFPLDMHIARKFVADRFALVGDAAHGVHPIAGQGLNIGFKDVAAITEVIIDALHLGLNIGSLNTLERYQQWRRFDSATSTFVMDALNRLFSNDNGPLRAIRDIGLGLVDRSPALKSFFVQEASGLSGSVPKLLKGERLNML